MTSTAPDRRYRLTLMVGALGVVYGDIGTSPLYALRECFTGAHHVEPTHANVLGVLSLVVWSLVLSVCIKYASFVLRADNRGEGGILALMSLAAADDKRDPRVMLAMVTCGLLGASLLYGEGLITPCITVMGAIEGLKEATPVFEPYLVPISIGVLLILFLFQRAGTGQVGRVFGPVMVVWFATLAVLGVRGILMHPAVLQAVSPTHALAFLRDNGYLAFLVMGSVVLVITGVEALYADLGHFGKSPIRRAWFWVVFPSLLLNYFGQGALILQDSTADSNPFFRLAPAAWLYPLVVLATVASVIASQALISGAFSITMQAIQLGFLPRMEIRHTSSEERGQIFLPYVNMLLLVCCIGLCIGFKTSTALASAYGIAVTTTMMCTSVLLYFTARRRWGWSRWRAAPLCLLFLAVESVFFAANMVKFAQGGWFPLLVATLLFLVMATWKKGRRLLGERLQATTLPLDSFLQGLQSGPPLRVRGTAIYMAGNPQGTPLALLHNLKHNKVLHERVVLLTMLTADQPHVPPERRVEIEPLSEGFCRVRARFGFMEQPQIGEVLQAVQQQGMEIKRAESTFFLSRETVLPSARTSMARWRSLLFAFLSRNAQPATTFFGLPVDRVVELGVQVEV